MDTKRLSQALAVAALGVGLIVALAQNSGRSAAPATPEAPWAVALEQEKDHISASELADRLLAQRDDTVLIDVRPASEFAAWHLPGAVNMDVPRLVGEDGRTLLAGTADELVVLYSNGMVHPGQAWVELARQGHTNVRVLEGGLTEFKREVLTPPSLRGPVSEARAAMARPRFEAARKFFLGGRAQHDASTRQTASK